MLKVEERQKSGYSGDLPCPTKLAVKTDPEPTPSCNSTSALPASNINRKPVDIEELFQNRLLRQLQ